MKRITRNVSIISTLLLMLLMASDCNPEPGPTPTLDPPTPTLDPPTPTASITLSIPSTGPISQTTDGNAAATFEAGGGTANLPFSTTAAWTASSDASWCAVSPASGVAASASVTLTIAKNETYDERTATVTLQAGTAKKTVTVKQGPAGGMMVSPGTIAVPFEGGEYEIEVQHNVTYTISISEDAKNWISVNGTRALTTDKVGISVSPNDGATSREGIITFKSTVSEATVTVTQAMDERFTVEPTSVELSAEGGTFDVTVKTLKTYHISSKPEWVSEQSVNGKVHTFEVGANEMLIGRSGVIVFCDDLGTCQSCAVQQDGDPNQIDWNQGFYHRSLIFRFTANWCQYCPQMATSLKKSHESFPDRFVSVNIHGNGSKYQFTHYAVWENLFDVHGYPFSYMDMRREIANYSSSNYIVELVGDYLKEQEETYPASSTIAMSSTLSGNRLDVETTLFVKEAGDYKVAVYLTESGIIGYQSDIINGYQNDYQHDDIVRIALSNVLGDALPIESDHTALKRTYSVNIPSDYNKNTLKVLVFVMRTYGSQTHLSSGDYGDYYIDNCVYGKVGDTLPPAIVTKNDGGNEGLIDGKPVNW